MENVESVTVTFRYPLRDISGWCPSSSARTASLFRNSIPACIEAINAHRDNEQIILSLCLTMKFLVANVRAIDFLSWLRTQDGHIWAMYCDLSLEADALVASGIKLPEQSALLTTMSGFRHN